jgi:chromosome segregation ATPase
LDTREFIEFCTREEARLKWYAEARGVAETLLAVKTETEKAEKERDTAQADRDAAVADLEAKKEKYQREGEATLADLTRVFKEKAELASAATARAAAELAQLQAQTAAARTALEQVQADLTRTAREAREEMAAIQGQLDGLRAERQAIRERVAAALKE